MQDGIDTVILRILREREQFDKLFDSLPLYAFDEKTQVLLRDYKEYFNEFQHDVIDPDTFDSWFFAFQHPTLKGDNKSFYTKLLGRLTEPVNADTKKGIVARILELGFATNVANLVKKYETGEDIDIQRAIDEASETLKVHLDRKVKVPWVKDSIHDLLDESGADHGIRWRLDCLNQSMRPLRPGDFGVIAGRPDTGKTTFVSSEITFMASQMHTFYKEDRPILWFNNEGPGKRIVPRLYQSALNCSISDLLLRKKTGTIIEDYKKAVGALENIRVMDVHDMWNYDIVDIVREQRPGLIIFDMIDNIKFHSSMGQQGARTDQVLEGMYQWARVLGVRFDCPVLGTSQISVEGDGMQFPTLSMLKDSKTGKQGASDFQLMLGKSNEVGMENSRFISLPKNKLSVEGFAKDPRCEVIFDGLRARYITPKN